MHSMASLCCYSIYCSLCCELIECTLKGLCGCSARLCLAHAGQVGKGALTVREDARMVAEKDPQKVQEPAGPAFRDMAADAAEFQVCSRLHPLSCRMGPEGADLQSLIRTVLPTLLSGFMNAAITS